MLLRRPKAQSKLGKDLLNARFDAFARGKWADLLLSDYTPTLQATQPEHPPSLERRALQAQASIQLGEVSRARHKLVGAPLAPRTDVTFDALQSKRPKVAQSPIPDDIRNYHPPKPVSLDRQTVITCLTTAPRGASPGPGGLTYEHLKLVLDEGDLLELMIAALEDLARARLPEPISIFDRRRREFDSSGYRRGLRLRYLFPKVDRINGMCSAECVGSLLARRIGHVNGPDVHVADLGRH